MLNNETCSC
ncbi:hypothetical protein EH150_04635 [Carnobacterium divergens]|nr:hypothetical protein [Carnobacterium divergens]